MSPHGIPPDGAAYSHAVCPGWCRPPAVSASGWRFDKPGCWHEGAVVRRPEDALTLTGTHLLSVCVCLGAHLCVCVLAPTVPDSHPLSPARPKTLNTAPALGLDWGLPWGSWALDVSAGCRGSGVRVLLALPPHLAPWEECFPRGSWVRPPLPPLDWAGLCLWVWTPPFL